MRTYLGVDGGGSKTAFVVIDESGRVLATHAEGPAYYFEIGLDEMRRMLARGIDAVLRRADLQPSSLSFAFLGLPAYGEDSRLLPTLDSSASPILAAGRYRCGNDALCGWAGALACQDGINIVAGTGSIAYGEFAGRSARAGGWGELFGDEGSAYWIAREGLALFSRMSDGRSPRGPLRDMVRRHYGLQFDLDLCAAIYGANAVARSKLAELSVLMAQAADAGDEDVRAIFRRAAGELAEIIAAVRSRLQVPDSQTVDVSYSGGMLQLQELLLKPLQTALAAQGAGYRFLTPRMPPAPGAALYAARLSGAPLDVGAVSVLAASYQETRSTD